MANINISARDFATLADAANAALRRGDREAATALDVLARKANAALGHASVSKLGGAGLPILPRMKWHDVPSCLIDG